MIAGGAVDDLPLVGDPGELSAPDVDLADLITVAHAPVVVEAAVSLLQGHSVRYI